VFDLASGSLLGSVTNDDRNLNYVALSPDRKWLATGTWQAREATSVWEVKTGRKLRELDRMSSTVAFSPDNRTLVTCNSREYVFWDTATWQPRHRVATTQGIAVPGPSAFARDGTLLAIAPTRTHIKLLNPQTSAEIASLTPPEHQNITSLTFSADGQQLAATTESRAVQLWDLRALRRELAALGLDW
jgi:WD40 repeat protein